MTVKAIKDIDTALRIFYTYPELNNKLIRELFGGLGNSTIARYKQVVKDQQAIDGVQTAQRNTVNTETAYKVWRIDVENLIKRRAKLQKLGL